MASTPTARPPRPPGFPGFEADNGQARTLRFNPAGSAVSSKPYPRRQ
jgi:hypothetical protein